MPSSPRSARALYLVIAGGYPILVVLYVWTSIFAARNSGWTYGNPISWAGANGWRGVVDIVHGAGTQVAGDLLAFYRSDPWGNWIMVDHLGLKVLLSFLLYWDAAARGRRVWPYLVLLYVVGALAPLLYMVPVLRREVRLAPPMAPAALRTENA